MHAQGGHPIAGAHDSDMPTASDARVLLLDSLSDTLMNAFSRVSKPDPTFVAMARELEQRKDMLSHLERVTSRMRFHTAGTYGGFG